MKLHALGILRYHIQIFSYSYKNRIARSFYGIHWNRMTRRDGSLISTSGMRAIKITTKTYELFSENQRGTNLFNDAFLMGADRRSDDA